ncbi:hypothetical protein QBC35DRAFT_379355 [Podospora australis]|uniref:Ketoreductase domain-containing protein n=1 Tax=Podospora australis TaxID=1536484 RepID=A0AAN7AIE9_9PEZI|nr:hypothetical protein QBC35DRAFT_379355 [Podospora australis]
MGLLSLAGKIALITGGSSGIGKAIAKRFVEEGAQVVIASRNAAPTTAETVTDHHSTNITYAKLDVGRPKEWYMLLGKIPDVDVLVNCAGITNNKLLIRQQNEDIEQVVSTNLTGAIYGCKFVGKKMLSRRNGCIINVSSLLATRAVVGTAVYAATKAGVLGLTNSLALEYGGYGVRVNAILPGYIATSMTEDLDKEKLIESIPLKRFGTPEEVADAAAFLAKNGYANDCILNLAGGLSG